MSSERLYVRRTPSLERALTLATEAAGVPASASPAKKLEAWLEFSTRRVEDSLAYASRLQGYEELRQAADRRERVLRNTREAARRGLL